MYSDRIGEAFMQIWSCQGSKVRAFLQRADNQEWDKRAGRCELQHKSRVWIEQGTESSADEGTKQTWYQQSGRCRTVKLSTVICGGPSHPT